MKFPGKRKNKHYFPVQERGRLPLTTELSYSRENYVLGLDQPMVDIEARVDLDFLKKINVPHGGSVVLEEKEGSKLYHYLKQNNMITGEYPGGAIGNTLHNYSMLSNSRSILLGTISEQIAVGDYTYKYLCNTSSLVDLSYLRPTPDHLGLAFCFVTPDGERSFGISKGGMNDLREEFVTESLVANAKILLLSSYLLRDPNAPIFRASLKAARLAKQFHVPIVFSLGAENVVREKVEFLTDFITEYVTVAAMNENEAFCLSGKDDPLLAGEWFTDRVDMALITVGDRGLYFCGHVDRELARKTKDELYSKSIENYNLYEYSRGMMRSQCSSDSVKIYTHINPYMGGPTKISNTNGAGDAALAAVIHDIVANSYHKQLMPESQKHQREFLTYSSLAQVSKYANRVSFEVLVQDSPRLLHGLPDKEDSLEEAYWER
jgi:inosine kinase